MSDRLDLDAAERLFNDKNECSPRVFRVGTAIVARVRAAEQHAAGMAIKLLEAEAERDALKTAGVRVPAEQETPK